MIEIELKRIADALEALVAHTIAPRAALVQPVVPVATSAAAETPAAAAPEVPKRGRGRPPNPTSAPAPVAPPAPAAPETEPEADFLAEEQAAPTKDDVLQALLAAKAKRSAAIAKGGVEKTAAEAQAHREIGELLKKSAGVATLTALPAEKYAAVIAAAAAV
jgi:type IV secretory pathway VirB10-like protein